MELSAVYICFVVRKTLTTMLLQQSLVTFEPISNIAIISSVYSFALKLNFLYIFFRVCGFINVQC